MSKYTVIADVGKSMQNMLRDKLVPEPISSASHIGLCDPSSRGDFVVGIHAYDIREDNTRGAQKAPIMTPDGRMKNPPTMIELCYMISVSSKAASEEKAIDEAKIIGKIIQTFQDNPVIPAEYIPVTAGETLDNVMITSLPINMEEKVKIWTMFGEAYKLSVFYIVGPVTIDSAVTTKIKPRVETIILGSSQGVRKRKIIFESKIKEEDIEDEYNEEEEDEEDEFGDDDSGEDEFGDDDSGDDDSGDDGFSDDDSGDDGFGDDDSGDDGLGDEESGDDGFGDEESGDDGFGDEESGDDGLGDEESGDDGLGDEESGDDGFGDDDPDDSDLEDDINFDEEE